MTSDGCWYGCSLSCAKAADNLVLRTGPYKGHMSPSTAPSTRLRRARLQPRHLRPDWLIEQNYYCDPYGIDTIT